MPNRALYGAAIVGMTVIMSCAHDITRSTAIADSDAVAVLSVVPASGATNVDPSAPIVITFNHPMRMSLESVVLHEDSVTGRTVSGVITWSGDRTRLTFTPDARLRPRTTYLLHLLPTLADAAGRPVDFGSCAGRTGGQSAWPMGRGMPGQWSGGMIFRFTTAD